MRILLDQGTPAPLRTALADHDVQTAFERGWQSLSNGDLLKVAEADGLQLIITTDQNIRYQQNLDERGIAILVLGRTDRRRIRRHVELVASVVAKCEPSSYTELAIPAD